ncbi:MAG: hypothetical protein M1537_01750 [Nitrospirae bacterium]|nr:hypothetical protein [Nitrospirota bacterium]
MPDSGFDLASLKILAFLKPEIHELFGHGFFKGRQKRIKQLCKFILVHPSLAHFSTSKSKFPLEEDLLAPEYLPSRTLIALS